MLGDPLYGEVLYGEDKNKERIYELPEQYTDLTKYVPPFIADLGEMAALLKAQGYEVGRAHVLMDSMFDQSVPHLATWDLDHWEQMLDITNPDTVGDETRQILIMEKLAGTQTLTSERIVEIAANVTGEEVSVQEEPAKYKFTVLFTGSYGIPNHVKLFKRIIEELKPAHLGCEFTYRYVIWNELTGKTWTDCTEYTWDGLRINEKIAYVSWASLATALPSWRSIRPNSWNTTTKLEEAME